MSKKAEYEKLTVAPNCPASLMKALNIIDRSLWKVMLKSPGIQTNKQLENACLLMSLTTRDFMIGAGFSAEVVPCCLHVVALTPPDTVHHSLGVGFPHGDPNRHHLHMVVRITAESIAAKEAKTEPGADWMVDTTLIQARRPQWPKLPSMVALPIIPEYVPPALRRYGEHKGMTSFALAAAAGGNARTYVTWLDNPTNDTWIGAPDTRPERRDRSVHKLLVEWRNSK